MSVSEWEQAKSSYRERRMTITIDCEAIGKHDSANRDIIKTEQNRMISKWKKGAK